MAEKDIALGAATAVAGGATIILFALRQWLGWQSPSDTKAGRELRDELRVQNTVLREQNDQLRAQNASLLAEAHKARAEAEAERQRCSSMTEDLRRTVRDHEAKIKQLLDECGWLRGALDRMHGELPTAGGR